MVEGFQPFLFHLVQFTIPFHQGKMAIRMNGRGDIRQIDNAACAKYISAKTDFIECHRVLHV